MSGPEGFRDIAGHLHRGQSQHMLEKLELDPKP